MESVKKQDVVVEDEVENDICAEEIIAKAQSLLQVYARLVDGVVSDNKLKWPMDQDFVHGLYIILLDVDLELNQLFEYHRKLERFKALNEKAFMELEKYDEEEKKKVEAIS